MRRLLVLDDFIATGESVAHVIEILRHNTIAIPEVVIAAPLWVPPKERSASFVDGVMEARLRSVIARAEAGVLRNDARFRHLYDDDVVTRPLFCFGRVPIASYFTIGANPSADYFRAGRWGAGDLASQCFSYFDRAVPHDFFWNWEAALEPLWHGVSYKSGGLAHLDVSPRATKSLRAINKLGDAVIDEFLAMARADVSYLFAILAMVWPQVRGLFAAGTITKKRYIDAFLVDVGPSHGFVFHRRGGPLAHSKVYDVTFGGRSLPLFFCSKGPSADRPGEQEYFRAQIRENTEYLRSLFT